MDNRVRNEVDLSSLDEEVIQNDTTQEPEEEVSDSLESNFEDNVAVIKKNTEVSEENLDYKNKFVESTREASALYFKNQKLNSVIEEAANISDPTTEELVEFAKSRGADYEDLDEFSQNILKDTLINNKRFEKIQNVARESKQIDEWANKVDSFIEDAVDNSKYPSLNSLGTDFKKFAMKESRRGVDLDDLVASFLFSAERSMTQKKTNGSVLLSNGNSLAAPQKATGITEAQAAFIRENDPREYRRLIKTGQINIEL